MKDSLLASLHSMLKNIASSIDIILDIPTLIYFTRHFSK